VGERATGSGESFFSLRITRSIAVDASLAVGSGVLASLAFPPYELWPLAWVALVPLLIALRRTQAVRASGWLALLFGIVFISLTLRWLSAIFGTGLVGVSLLGSLPLILFGLSYRFVSARSSPSALVLMTPILWLAVDWLRCDGWYFRFSWAQLGFTLTPCAWGLRIYPVIGVYGATFLMVLVNAAVAATLDGESGRRSSKIGLILAGMIVGSACVAACLVRPPVPGGALTVRAVQDESGDLETLKQLTLKPGKPTLTVWPEYSVSEYPLSRPALLAELRQVARESGGVLILGCKEHTPRNARCDWFRRRARSDGLFYNTALLIGPQGNVLGTYHKTHPIQLFSDGVPGGAYPVFATPAGRVGIAICYDFDFASCPLNLVRNGAELLAVPTFDPANWGGLQHRQHARMAQARAAEMGRWVVRATSSGVSQIIDPRGRVTGSISELLSGQLTRPAARVADLTTYCRATFVLPYLCMGATIICLAYLGFRRSARNSD
jgi:apolipoprotein N-acyltransferase